MMSLLQMSFSGAVLILVIAAIRAVTINRLPKKTFLILWGIVLFRLLIPYTVPSAFSVYNFLKPQMPVYETDTNFTNQAGTVNTTAPTPANVISSPNEPIAVPQVKETVDLPENKITSVSKWTLIRMTGTLLCAIFFIISYLHWRFEFQASLPVQSDFVEQWRKTHSLKRPIQIRQSDKISAPLTYGIIKPVILMPKKTDWENTGQLECVLWHEFVHIRRYDSVAKMICTIALCLHWFNPIVWVMYILFQRDIELACDESVVRRFGEASKATYAHMLIDMEAKKSGLMPLCNNFSKNAIEERIIAIMKIKKTSVIAILSAIILIAGTTTAFATSAAAQKAADNKEEIDKLLALQFDGYEDMSISKFQEKAWELTDTKEYLDFLDRVSQDTAFYEKRDSDELANFLFYTFNPLTGDQWRTREFGGYCKIGNDDLSDSVSLEYFITLDIQNADTLTVKEYNNTRIGIEDTLHEWLQDKTMEMLQEEAVLQKMLHAETEVLKSQWSSEKLKVDIDFVYTPLSVYDVQNSDTIKDNTPNNNAQNTEEEQEPRKYPNATEEDYRSLLTLKTPDYQTMSVADFNRTLLDWANEDHERMERINIDTVYDDFAVDLTDDERLFATLTVQFSGMENGAYVRSNYTGKPEVASSYGRYLPQKMKQQNGHSAWCDLYYQFSYHIKDKAAITVEERDRCVSGVITGVQEFWDNIALEDLLNMTKEDIVKALEEIVAAHSNNKITVVITEDQISFECMDELNMETEEGYKTDVIKLNLFPYQEELSGNTNSKNEMNAEALRVREEASEDAAVVYLLPEGQEVIIIGEEKGFYHISGIETDFDGWVIKEYVEEIDIIKE